MGKVIFILDIFIVLLVFCLGLIANTFLDTINHVPYSVNAAERNSPGNHIDIKDLNLYEDKLIINLEDIKLASFEDTNSMDPVLDKNTNAIEVIPENPAQIQIGDIISFKTNTGKIFIHRVIAISEDSEGIYFLTKGDNNEELDPLRVRFDDVVGLTIGLLY